MESTTSSYSSTSSTSSSSPEISIGEKARQLRDRALTFKSKQLFSQLIEPAVYQAADQGLSYCNVILDEMEYRWLLNASGSNVVFVNLVEKNGLSVHSFERVEVEGCCIIRVTLSWDEVVSEVSTTTPSAPPPLPKKTKQDPPPPLPRKTRQQVDPEISPAVRPFVGSYVQYPPTLHSICKSGDLNGLNQLLQFDVEINGPDSFGYTALHHAVSNGFLEHAEVLVQHGANVVAGGMKRLTPLHCAAYTGRPEVVRLLAPIANVNKLDNSARTPLHWAAERGYFEVTRELLAHGARVNIEDMYGMTPLKYALFWGFDNIIGMLEETARAEEEGDDEDEGCFELVEGEEELVEELGENDLEDVE